GGARRRGTARGGQNHVYLSRFYRHPDANGQSLVPYWFNVFSQPRNGNLAIIAFSSVHAHANHTSIFVLPSQLLSCDFHAVTLSQPWALETPERQRHYRILYWLEIP